MNRMFLINGSLIANLNEATKKIQTDPDLESNDMPVLNELIAALHSMAAARTAALHASGLSKQPSAEKPESDTFLTVEQCAEKMQLSKGYLYQLIRDGKFPATQVGERKYRIRNADLLNWKWEDCPLQPSIPGKSKKPFSKEDYSPDQGSAELYIARIRGPRLPKSEAQQSII